MAGEKKFSENVKCGHCLNKAPMEIIFSHSKIERASDSDWEWHDIYDLLKCPACEHLLLRRCGWNDSMDPDDVSYESLYPPSEKELRGLPQKIDHGYKAAQRVRNIDPNAYGVLLGRVLDLVCQDRKAEGDTLDGQLKDLADRGEIPVKLVDVASGLRKLRNIGAHAELGELTTAELPVLDDLTRSLLEYVYSAALLADEAKSQLEKLKKRKKAAKASS